MLVRLAYGLPLRAIHVHLQVADERDHTSRQFRDPQSGGTLLHAERWLHTEELYFRKQCGERVVELVLDECDCLPQLAPGYRRSSLRPCLGGRWIGISTSGSGRPRGRLSHD